jgi:mono/diheme cytochrome c family protein
MAPSWRFKSANQALPVTGKRFLVLFFKKELLAFLVLTSNAAAAPEPGLATLYTWHCSGCHGTAGQGVPAAGIPDLHDAGSYVALPEGRAYLAQVPGISQSRLDDATAARMLNYVLARFSAASLPANFPPYTAAEVARLRADKASDAETRRAAILAGLKRQGRVPPNYRPNK